MTGDSTYKKRVGPARVPDVFRPRDMEGLGLSRYRLRGMLRRGEVERIGRGLYRFQSSPPTELETIALVSARVPRAVICLLTALHVHGIGTEVPREVWIALDRKSRRPTLEGLPVRIVRFSGEMLNYAVESRNIQGVRVRITSPARTIVDCFRYRKKIGLDVALEALHDGLRLKRTSVDEIERTAAACRIRTVIRPYLESAVS